MTYLIITVLFLPGIILRFYPFRSFTDKKQRIVISILYCVALALHAVIWFFMLKSNALDISFLKADLILFPFFLIFINAFIIKNRLREHLFVCGLDVLFEYMNVTLSLLLSNLILKYNSSIGDPFKLYIAFYVVLQLVFIPLTLNLLKMTVSPFLKLEKCDYWRWIWFVPTAMVLVCYFSVYGEKTIDTLPPFIARLFLMISAVIICINLAKDYLLLTEQLETKKQLDMQKEYYSELSQQVERARRTRHDLKHHIAALRHYIDTDDKSGLSEYCDKYAAAVSDDSIPYTGNSAADGVLYHYAEKAKSNNIAFEIKGTIESESINDIDLCTLLGNALDNAFTASKTLRNDRFISVISESDDFMLSVVIVNSYDGVVDKRGERLLSRKESGRHGLGLDSMRKIAEKYGGTMEISYDARTFKVIFLLPIKRD